MDGCWPTDLSHLTACATHLGNDLFSTVPNPFRKFVPGVLSQDCIANAWVKAPTVVKMIRCSDFVPALQRVTGDIRNDSSSCHVTPVFSNRIRVIASVAMLFPT